MQPESLYERASKAADESRKILALLNAFEAGFEKRWLEALRRSVTREVEQAYQEAIEKAKAIAEEISRHPELHPNKEIRVFSVYGKDSGVYLLSAAEMKKRTAQRDADEYRKKGAVHLRLEDFRRQMQELITSILEGELDGDLHLSTEQLIYNKMRAT